MTEPVYIPLKPDGKQPAVKGWQRPDYKGVEPKGRVGRRADGLVIVDCDSDEAASLWNDVTGGAPDTYRVSTPRGMHFYYEAGPDAPTGPAVGVLEGVDIRAGAGSYVVCPPTPGYEAVGKRPRKVQPFQARWLPQKSQAEALASASEEWETVPEGRRNDTLAAFAGAFRRQGMDAGTMYQLLLGINEGLCDPPLPREEIETIVRSVARYEPDPDISIELVGQESIAEADDLLQWLSGMTLPPPPQWWWKPYLPKGRLVLLDGSEGIGKGLFCAHLATMIGLKAPVLWLATEDDPEEDIQRRLLAAGWSADTHFDVGFFTKDPKFPTHTDALEEIIREHDAGLVIMDPGRSYLAPPDGSRGMSYNDEAHIRPGLEAINRMAKRTGCTVVFVHHWNKNTQTTVQYRSGGSGAFAQVVRHRITLVWHGPTEGGEGAFEVSKSNIGPKGHVHGYAVEPVSKFDTAAFVLTEPMPEFSDLGSWLKTVERESDGIDIDRTPEVQDALKALPAGAPVPAVRELAQTYGISRDDAKAVLTDFLEEGVLRRGPHNRLFRVGKDER